MRLIARPALMSLAILAGLASFNYLPASDSAHDVQHSLSAMQKWLASSPVYGPRWRRYLRTSDLQAQLDLGPVADRDAVAAILELYTGDKSGLTARRFVAVRSALENWLSELSDRTKAADLPKLAAAAKDKFKALDSTAIDDARRQARTALRRLEQYLARLPQEQRDSWNEMLNVDALQAEVAKEDEADLQVLQQAMAKLRGYEEGLERSEFTNVRDAITQYHNAIYFSDPKIQQAYKGNLTALEDRLKKYVQTGAGESAADTGRILGFLESGKQAQDLIQAVRSNYWHPNLYGNVSREILAAAVERPVDQVMPVRESILGTMVRGTANTVGEVSLSLVPNPSKAAFEIQLSGTANSKNVGRRGRVTIYSRGSTEIDGKKLVLIDENGFDLQPADANCKTKTRITGVNAPHLIRNIAWRQVQQKKGQASSIANYRAERRVQRQIDDEAAESLDEPKTSFVEKFRKPLLRRGEFPRLLRFSTTEDNVLIKGLQANMFQLAATGAPPKLAKEHDMSLRVHESLVNNLGEALLGREKITGEQLADALKDLTGKVPEELQKSNEGEEWSITFNAFRPITAEFKDQHVTITIRGTRFTRGDQELRENMYITAIYKMQKEKGGAKLVRQGDVEVGYLKKGRQTTAQITFKSFMKKKFEALFKEEMVSDGLELPGKLADAGKLQLDELVSKNHWLSIGWRMPAKAAADSAAQALGAE